MKAGSLEHRHSQRDRARADIREIRRMLHAGELPPDQARAVRRVLSLAWDDRNAEMIRRIAYLPLVVPMSPSRTLAWAICRTRGWGNLRGDRNPT